VKGLENDEEIFEKEIRIQHVSTLK